MNNNEMIIVGLSDFIPLIPGMPSTAIPAKEILIKAGESVRLKQNTIQNNSNSLSRCSMMAFKVFNIIWRSSVLQLNFD